MSRWLYYHLRDGDLASNMLSWQWIAGTNAGKRYVANQAVIDGCSDVKQGKSYLSIPREEVGEGAIPEVLKNSVPFSYTTSYPESEVFDTTASTLFLYSPWTLNPDWRADEVGERVLLIEPKWFDRFPVSADVLTFIITVARTQIPGVKVVVANAEELSMAPGVQIFSRAYPTHTKWPGIQDAPARLFPQVTGYFPSFFKFWEACQKGAQ
jgi:deoxyribodipyrimidine photo-lyase